MKKRHRVGSARKKWKAETRPTRHFHDSEYNRVMDAASAGTDPLAARQPGRVQRIAMRRELGRLLRTYPKNSKIRDRIYQLENQIQPWWERS